MVANFASFKFISYLRPYSAEHVYQEWGVRTIQAAGCRSRLQLPTARNRASLENAKTRDALGLNLENAKTRCALGTNLVIHFAGEWSNFFGNLKTAMRTCFTETAMRTPFTRIPRNDSNIIDNCATLAVLDTEIKRILFVG